MRTFLNHIKNETLDEIKTSLENFWQQMIQLSEFFQYSFVLILKRKCLVRASRVRSGESGTPSTIIYVRWSSRRYELGCDTPVIITYVPFTSIGASLTSIQKSACDKWNHLNSQKRTRADQINTMGLQFNASSNPQVVFSVSDWRGDLN